MDFHSLIGEFVGGITPRVDDSRSPPRMSKRRHFRLLPSSRTLSQYRCWVVCLLIQNDRLHSHTYTQSVLAASNFQTRQFRDLNFECDLGQFLQIHSSSPLPMLINFILLFPIFIFFRRLCTFLPVAMLTCTLEIRGIGIPVPRSRN